MIDIKPMKMTDIDLARADDFLADPAWVLEQKHDGARALIGAEWNPSTMVFDIEFQASGGGPLKFAAAVQHFAKLREELSWILQRAGVKLAVLDGELMTEEGELRLFDMPYLERYQDEGLPLVTTKTPYLSRRSELAMLLRGGSDRVQAAYMASTYEEKVELWAAINEAGVEGGMVKNIHAPYEPGIRTKEQLKLKLVKSADVIVSDISNWTHRTGSATLQVCILPHQDPRPYKSPVTGKRLSNEERDAMLSSSMKAKKARALAHEYLPRERLTIGNASLIGKDRSIEVGSVVEVEYLYWTGGALVQPRIVRKRLAEEKLAEDCTLDQFPTYQRVAVMG